MALCESDVACLFRILSAGSLSMCVCVCVCVCVSLAQVGSGAVRQNVKPKAYYCKPAEESPNTSGEVQSDLA